MREWFSYGEAAIVEYDETLGLARKLLTYETPDDIRPPAKDSNIVFKAGSLHGGRLLVCTQTEILVYSLPDFKQVGYVSHPWLNDVHHVIVNEVGNYLVANTGLDMVLELTPDGQEVQAYSAIPNEDIWLRFDKSVDYRKVVTTKPHHAHPNYVFQVGAETWVSRFVQQDVLCLTSPDKRIDIGIERVHDGNYFKGRLYLTTVNGHVVVADPKTCQVIADYDLNEMTETNKTLGWCRGLCVLDENRVVVGFSRIRPSKFRENVRWAKFVIGQREDAGMLPTRIAQYNLLAGTIEWSYDLESCNLNAVFSILPSWS